MKLHAEYGYIHYFPSKQGLAINLPWPALKNKQRMSAMCFELFEVFLTSADQCFFLLLSFFVVDDLHLQIIQSISTVLHWVKSSVCQQSTVTECILILLDHSTAWGGRAIIIFIDLVSTNILLAMLGFPLSPKRHADFCFKPSQLFF